MMSGYQLIVSQVLKFGSWKATSRTTKAVLGACEPPDTRHAKRLATQMACYGVAWLSELQLPLATDNKKGCKNL